MLIGIDVSTATPPSVQSFQTKGKVLEVQIKLQALYGVATSKLYLELILYKTCFAYIS